MNVHDLDEAQVALFRRIQNDECCEAVECAQIGDDNAHCHCWETFRREVVPHATTA